MSRLSEMQTRLTNQLILDSALELLAARSAEALTVRAIAKQAGMSERTVFRYYASRDELLDAIAAALTARLALPALEETLESLLQMPGRMFARYEEERALTVAALHSDLFERIVKTSGTARWAAIERIVKRYAAEATAQEQLIATANIRYLLTATTWHYYRVLYGLDQDTAVTCVSRALHQALQGVGVHCPAH